MKKIYVDAGGTKVASYLVDSNNISKKIINASGNINTDYEQAKKNILLAISSFDLDESIEIFIGAAGANVNVLFARQLENDFKKMLPNCTISVKGDLDLMCELIDDKNFLFINCGTGTVAIYNDKNNINNLYLGWGKLVNDIGSGYDIGINFIQFLTYCEDVKNNNPIYLKFLKEYKLDSIRNLIPIITQDYNQVSMISSWLALQDIKTIETFILTRVKILFEYLNFIEFNNLYLTGSIFEKNKEVQLFSKNYYNNKKIKIINFFELLEHKFSHS